MGRDSFDPRWRAMRADGSPFPGHEHPAMMALRSGTAVDGQTMGVFHPSTGEVRWLLVTATPLFEDGEAAPSAVFAAFADITELRQTRQALDESERASLAKSDFIASMSHELRTPLNSIIGFSGVLLEGMSGPLSDDQRTQIGMIGNSGQQLLSLVDQILDLAAIESGRAKPSVAQFEPGDLARALIASLGPSAAEHGLALECETDEAPERMLSDPARLQQILLNLLGNALKYTDEGEVRLTVTSGPGDSTVFTVSDTGRGIPPVMQRAVFDRFVRADPDALVPGTGLGLTITRELVSLLRGTISVSSEPGRGSRFTVTLPDLPPQREPDPR